MADELFSRPLATMKAQPDLRSFTANFAPAIAPERLLSAMRWTPPATSPPPDKPAPAPQAPPSEGAGVPSAPPTNPFETLPMPSPGDRIRSDDFRALSNALRLVYEASVVSAGLFGRTFGEAKVLLLGQRYEIGRVMTVLGSELTALDDPSLDERRVVHVAPTALGERGVLVVLTEEVDRTRYAPDLTTAPTYASAVAMLRERMGPVRSPTPVLAPDLVGLSLHDLDERNP